MPRIKIFLDKHRGNIIIALYCFILSISHIMEKNDIVYWENFGNKIEKLKNSDKDSIQVVSDFDWTLTYIKNKATNKVVPAIISVLYNEWYLSKDYSEKAKELENTYKPIEKDESLWLDERKEKMAEWWKKHNELLIKSWLTKQHIDSVIDSGIVQLRDGCNKFFEVLHNQWIPIMIFSASWLWTYAISTYLQRAWINYDNIHIVSNDFVWDDGWNAISWKEPFVTSLNKDETLISNKIFPEIYKEIKDKKDVVLLWNSLWDVPMASDSNNNFVLRVWFLWEDNMDKLEKFKEKFDIVLIWDWWMDEIIEILKQNI